jgi:hypothetical protein
VRKKLNFCEDEFYVAEYKLFAGRSCIYKYNNNRFTFWGFMPPNKSSPYLGVVDLNNVSLWFSKIEKMSKEQKLELL